MSWKPKRGFSIIKSIRRVKSVSYGTNWQAIAEAVKTRDGCRCRYCKNVFPRNRLEAHHIVPVSKGGATALYNLATTCTGCHEKRPGHSHLR